MTVDEINDIVYRDYYARLYVLVTDRKSILAPRYVFGTPKNASEVCQSASIRTHSADGKEWFDVFRLWYRTRHRKYDIDYVDKLMNINYGTTNLEEVTAWGRSGIL